VVAKRTDSESVAPPGVYKKAEQRFQKVAKRALEKLIAADKA
jgi:uridine phosphorylase